MIDVLLGLQWGDEGKGKIVDFLAPQYDIIARFQGGPNAGHTLYVNQQKVVLHTLPSGVFHKRIMNVIGNGVVLDPVSFKDECDKIISLGIELHNVLIISEKAHLITPTHKLLDLAKETAKGNNKIGSTLKGIGPTYMDKTGRNGLRIGDILSNDFKKKYEALKDEHLQILRFYNNVSLNLVEAEEAFFNSIELLKKYKIVPLEYWLSEQLAQNKKILAEGAQGTMLDIDFGTYPFVTSSNTISAGLCTGLGVSPHKVNKVIGISKAYCTRVGSGPFPTELENEDGEMLRKIGNEFGSTTGRPRRCGWIDTVALKYACMINGVTELIITKADVLDDMEKVGICTSYNIENESTQQFPFNIADKKIEPEILYMQKWNEKISTFSQYAQLPSTFKQFIDKIEELCNVNVSYISNGVNREQLIQKV